MNKPIKPDITGTNKNKKKRNLSPQAVFFIAERLFEQRVEKHLEQIRLADEKWEETVMDKFFVDSIVNDSMAAREFLTMYQTASDNEIADMYGIDTDDIKAIMAKMVDKYSIRKKRGVA